MTTNYVSPNVNPHAPTIQRPQLTFAPQAGPVPLPAVSSPTWKGGWVASGLAVVVSVTALSVVGVFAFDALTQPDPAPAASLLAPAAPPSTATDVAPAPVLPAPTVTANPATRAPAPVALAPRVIVVPRPTAAPAPAPHHNPVVVPVAPAPHPDPVVVPVIPVVIPPKPITPPKPVTPPKPPLGIGTCDLVACGPKPPIGIGTCDLVACPPQPPANRP